MKLTPAHLREIIIFAAMTCGGLITDMGTSTALVYGAGVPLVLAGACGLLVGAITNYFIHLKVTFRHRKLSPSWTGLFKYLQTCLIGAGVRLGVLSLLAWFSDLSSLVALIVATGVSFGVNYILARFYVFRHKSP